MPLTRIACVRVLIGASLLAGVATLVSACMTYDQYEGGGRRTDLSDGGFSASGSVTSDGGTGLPGDAGSDAGDSGCVAGDSGISLIQCL